MTYQQDLVNVLANIHNKANDVIALNCSAKAVFRIVGNNTLRNIGVVKEELDSFKLTDELLEEYNYLKSHATLSYLLIPNKHQPPQKKLSLWKRFISACLWKGS